MYNFICTLMDIVQKYASLRRTMTTSFECIRHKFAANYPADNSHCICQILTLFLIQRAVMEHNLNSLLPVVIRHLCEKMVFTHCSERTRRPAHSINIA